MTFSIQFLTSLHILLTIISFPDIRVTNEMISKDTNLSHEQVRKLIRKLKSANILTFQNGTGKATLAKKANEITLWDIYYAVENENLESLNKFALQMPYSILGENEKAVILSNIETSLKTLKESLSQRTLETIKDEIDIKNNQIAF